MIDDLVADRLRRQLASVDRAVAGVVAPVVSLPPGSSYRVCAERALLTPEACLEPCQDDHPRGAVLLRQGVPFEVRADAVAVSRHGLLVDHGAVVHDPWAHVGPLEPASPLGRPPFPWRPVTLFLGTAPDPLLADWVRQMVNGLLRRKDVEARMAVPSPTRGLHLARPCTPEAATVVTLAPDVVVALDERAIDAATTWLNGDRSAVVIELTPSTEPVPEVVPWRIGEARGRLRARISRGVDAEGLATLVRRLCAGPQPLPPRHRKRRAAPATRPQRSSPAVGALDPSLRLVGLVGTPTDRPRFGGLADHVAAYGGRLAIHTVDELVLSEAEDADILLVRSLTPSSLIRDLVAARTGAGRLTVVDLASVDVAVTPAARRVELRAEAADLARSASAVTTTSPRLAALLRARGVRSHVLPTLITRSRAATLTKHRARRPAGPSHIIGWHTGTRHPRGDPHRTAVLDTLRTLLATRTDLTVEVVGDVPGAAARIRGDRVTVNPGAPEIESVSKWHVQLWTTSSIDSELTGDVGPVIDGHYLGVPTLVAADNIAVHEGLVVRSLAVEDPEQWRSVMGLIDDEGTWSTRSGQAARLAEALYGPGSSLATLNRLMGWLRFEGGS